MNNLQKHFLSYELSKEFKELGFNEACMAYYEIKEPNKLKPVPSKDEINAFCANTNQLLVAAPLVPQALEFLREKYDVVVETLVFDKGFLEKNKFCYQWRVYPTSDNWITGTEFKTYEQAQLAGIKQVVELIKQKKQ